MGLHSYLAKHHIEYGSPESIEFTNIYFMLYELLDLVESNNIARERQETFVGFENSKYADGSYFDKYVTGQYVPKSDRVKELFEATSSHKPRIGRNYVNSLKKMVSTIKTVWLLRQMAQSLTLTTVLLLFIQSHNVLKKRQEKKSENLLSSQRSSTDTIPFYTSAYDMDMRKVIDVYAAATEHVDQGLSLTLFLRSELPKEIYEWKNRK